MDWLSTKQAAPFVVSCTGVLPIGRVKWIEGSKYTGKDNFGWYRFEAGHTSGPVLLGSDPTRRSSRVLRAMREAVRAAPFGFQDLFQCLSPAHVP